MSDLSHEARQNALVRVHMSEAERANFDEFRVDVPNLTRGPVKSAPSLPDGIVPRDELLSTLNRRVFEALKDEPASKSVRLSWVGLLGGHWRGSFVMAPGDTSEANAKVYASVLKGSIMNFEQSDLKGIYKFVNLQFQKG